MKDTVKSHGSSLGKSIGWRIIGVITLGILTYIFTRNWITTTALTFVHHSVFLLVFYLNERFWRAKIKNLVGRRRNIAKALFYECVLGFYIGGGLAVLFTGSWRAITHITLIYISIKIIQYFFYDQIWKEAK